MNHDITAGVSHYSPAASLAVIGVKMSQLDLFAPIRTQVKIEQKTIKYPPAEKLYETLISLLAGAHGLVQINPLLREDLGLQRAFGLTGCAEQSVVQDTLDACSPENVQQLHEALDQIFQQHSRAAHHDWQRDLLILDADMSGMPCGKKAEFATKGYFARHRGRRGRQLGRVLATEYEEIVVDRLFAGKVQLQRALIPLVRAVEKTLHLTAARRRRTLIRVDAGGGTIADLNWLLKRGYHILAKEYCSTRVSRLVKTVTLWHQHPRFPDRSFGWIEEPPKEYVRPLRRLAVRSQKEDGSYRSGILLCSLSAQEIVALLGLPSEQEPEAQMATYVKLYDQRGAGVETSLKGDKQGLGLTTRNKKRFCAQEMLVGLSQLAHNVLIWAKDWLTPTPQPRSIVEVSPTTTTSPTAQTRLVLRHYGIRRLVRDLFHLTGLLFFNAEGQLCRVILNEHSSLARCLLPAFQALVAPCQVAVCLGQT